MGTVLVAPIETAAKSFESPEVCGERQLYYCGLCDEAIVFSKIRISPRKIGLVFGENCPDCGLELDKVLKCEDYVLPLTVFAQHIFGDRYAPANGKSSPPVKSAASFSSEARPRLTSGIGDLDGFGLGQLAVLQGEASHRLSLLFCAVATLPPPQGFGSDVIFIDGGNLFDPSQISQQSMAFKREEERVQNRIHLSRAFTHHQLSFLIREKLPYALEKYKAKLAVISDITLLYCDPDVRGEREALDLFKGDISSLSKLAKRKEALVLVTVLRSRNQNMESLLTQYENVSRRLEME